MQKLQELYKESNMTLVELSKITGICTSTIHRYLKGNVKEINEKYYNPIAQALNCQTNKDKDVVDQSVSNEKAPIIDVDRLKQQMMSSGTFAVMDPKPVQKIHRGSIWYVKNNYASGAEQFGSRPALIISSDKLNEVLNTVTVVYLTSQAKQPLPTHITIRTSRDSIALCEQCFTLSKERLNNCMGNVTDYEMRLVDKGIMLGLGLHHSQDNIADTHDYHRLQVENRMLKEFNESLLSIAMK